MKNMNELGFTFHFRCDSCGGNANGCCEHSYPTQVDYFQQIPEGATLIKGNPNGFDRFSYKLADGKIVTVKRDPMGWGDDMTVN